MQTFLPYPSFRLTAKCLDYRRLGKQRLEAWQILNIITGKSEGWKNHPAVNMWRGYDSALKIYLLIICQEWKSRGYQDSILEKLLTEYKVPITVKDINNSIAPKWLGNKAFHNSHKSNLLRKDPIYYKKFKWKITNNLPYFWPVRLT